MPMITPDVGRQKPTGRSTDRHERKVGKDNMRFFRALFQGWSQKSGTDLYNEGIVAATRGDFDRAIRQFTEAIRLDPKLANAYCNRGAA